MSTRNMSPEIRLTLFNDFIGRSLTKFGKKYHDKLKNENIPIRTLKIFENRSERFKNIIKQLELENKDNISFADLYLNSREDMLIPCSTDKHGLVIMTPHSHISSPTGCTKCSGKYKRTQEEFDEDLRNTFGEKLTRISPYKNQNTPMRMMCNNKHGEFIKTGSYLLNGNQGCPICQREESSEKRRWKPAEWIEKAEKVHPDKKDDYLNIRLETVDDILWAIDILCIFHQTLYKQRANDHHKGHRCNKCKDNTLSNIFKMPYPLFLQRCRELHHENYEWPEKEPEDYKNGNSKISVICHNTYKNGEEHGIWYPSVHNHLQGSKCPKCNDRSSAIAREWLSMKQAGMKTHLQTLDSVEGEFSPIKDRKYKVDGYNKETNTIYEFHGTYYHGDPTRYKSDEINCKSGKTMGELYQNTVDKRINCLAAGYKYVEIWEKQWNIFKRLIRMAQMRFRKLKSTPI